VLQDVFAGLSTHSRYRRYFTVNPVLPPRTAERLAAVDSRTHLAVAAFDGRRAIGIARLVATGEGIAELGVEVGDAWHGRGIGSRLVRIIAAEGLHAGYQQVTGRVLVENGPGLALLQSVFTDLRRHDDAEDDELAVIASLASAGVDDATLPAAA
jgi:GNAT superfamily N-acetyltransferase